MYKDLYKDSPERVLCAAIWVADGRIRPHLPNNVTAGIVFAGWRHHNCFTTLYATFPRRRWWRWWYRIRHFFGIPGEEPRIVQGFLTTKGRFLTREEAATLAFKAGQIDRDNGRLTSEQIY